MAAVWLLAVCPVFAVSGMLTALAMQHIATRRAGHLRRQQLRDNQALIALAASNPDSRGDQLTEALRTYMHEPTDRKASS